MDTGRTSRRGFSLVEILFAIAVVGILIGLLVAGLTVGRRIAAGNVGTSTVSAIKMGVDEFSREFGFSPPIIRDVDLLTQAGSGERKFPVLLESNPDHKKFLQHQPSSLDGLPPKPPSWGSAAAYWDQRYSLASLPYYLIGVDETPVLAGSKIPIDGAPGVGILRPNGDGSFQIPENLKKPSVTAHRTGQSFGPFLDTGRSGAKVVRGGDKGERFEIRDTKGAAFRYYRWIQGDLNNQVKKTVDMNVPKVVGDPEQKPELRSAKYAIVWCGPDGVFGDEPLKDLLDALSLGQDVLEQTVRDKAIADNVVGVGQ